MVECDRAGGEAIHHGAVMRDEDDCALVAVEVGLHEALSVNIEVVGWLVKKKDFRFSKEELSHSDAHLPTTRELAAVAIKVIVLKAESS